MTVARYEASFAGVPQAAGQARAFVADCLPESCPRRDDAVLATSEAVTNAVRHTASGQVGGKLTIRVELTDTDVCVEVTDDGADTTPQARTGPADRPGDAVGGRGLPIVGRLGALQVSGDHTGHTVRIQLSISSVPLPTGVRS